MEQELEFPRCMFCGKTMTKGWMSDITDFYACSEECLHKFYEGEDDPEGQLQSDLDNEYIFYTEWDE